MQNDTLVRIPANVWEQLRDLFRQDWPRHEIAYNNVQNYIRWIERDPQISATLLVYSLNGNWRQTGTYIIIVSFARAPTLEPPKVVCCTRAPFSTGSYGCVYVHA